MPITWGNLKSQLAQAVGDAQTNGSPQYLVGSGAKWREPEYNSALVFSIELLRREYLIPTTGSLGMTSGTIYEFTVPDNMVYITELLRATEAGGTLFEKQIPLPIISPFRNSNGSLGIHMDKARTESLNLNTSGAAIRVRGYKYQQIPQITGSPGLPDGSLVDINLASVLELAKLHLHQSGSSRDPSEILKNMRQVEQARAIFAQLGDTVKPEPGGLWLDTN